MNEEKVEKLAERLEGGYIEGRRENSWIAEFNADTISSNELAARIILFLEDKICDYHVMKRWICGCASAPKGKP